MMDQDILLKDSIANFARNNPELFKKITQIIKYKYSDGLEYIRNDGYMNNEDIDKLWEYNGEEMDKLRHILSEYVHMNKESTYRTVWAFMKEEASKL